ncbi:Anaphase-promoting complex subunit 5 [Citrus sinensis]|nr:Anaphase-promoting complex subunit 5 [Citrus sinensis]
MSTKHQLLFPVSRRCSETPAGLRHISDEEPPSPRHRKPTKPARNLLLVQRDRACWHGCPCARASCWTHARKQLASRAHSLRASLLSAVRASVMRLQRAPRSRSATTPPVRSRSVTTTLARSRTVTNDLPGYDSGILKPPGAFAVTPHKVSVCILIQMYAPPAMMSVPFPFSSVAQHNRFGLYLFALTKSCDDIMEPKLDELINQLREIGDVLYQWLTDQLISRLSSLSSPDDLFNLFSDLRAILGGADLSAVDDEQVVLDPNSNLGMFVRRCLLAFNLLCFEGVCHLLTSIGIYCKEALSSCSAYELPCLDDSSNELEALSEYENMDLENIVFEKVNKEIEARKKASEEVSFHLHAPKALFGLVEDIKVSAVSKSQGGDKCREASPSAHAPNDAMREFDSISGAFLRTNWQMQGYLMEQADAIEKHGSSFSLNAFELILRQLQKLAPELHRVHFLRYLNSLYHDDYFAALENLHRYFDYSFGRYEIALLCLGMMHFHFGHPKQALDVLTEAVCLSQQHSNDTCLAYTLAAISNLLSEIGISTTTGILGSSYSPITSIGTTLSVQQQLFVLLKESFRRAESLKLKRLVAANHLAMAKFDLTHVQRPLLSFGPKTAMRLRTCPTNVCKELRLASHLISDFVSESSTMTTDGAFSTSWLKNLQKPMGSLVLTQENVSGKDSNAFQFCAQPSSIPGSVLQLVGSSYLLRATAWEAYGSAPLTRVNTLIYATCFSDGSSLSDVALAHMKLIQHLAVFKGYKEAFSALKIAEEKFLSVSKSRILLLKLQLLHERSLHRGHLKLAQKVCDELGVMASSVTGVDMDLKTEASLRHARTLLAANQFSEKSGNAVLGIPYALASLSFCQLLNLDLLKASATLTLAELWLSFGPNHAKMASNLIQQALPLILGHGGLELRARAFIAEAKCLLSDPSFSVSQNPEAVLDPLRQASEELQVLESLNIAFVAQYHELAAEAFYLIAIVSDKLGRLAEREEAAALFKEHVLALENENRQDEVDPLPSTPTQLLYNCDIVSRFLSFCDVTIGFQGNLSNVLEIATLAEILPPPMVSRACLVDIKRETRVLTDEGKKYAAEGSSEIQLFLAVPAECSILKDELQKKPDSALFEIGCSQSGRNKWVEMGQQVSRKKGDWKELEFKEYNFNAKAQPADPLLKVRKQLKDIFLQMG